MDYCKAEQGCELEKVEAQSDTATEAASTSWSDEVVQAPVQGQMCVPMITECVQEIFG